MIWMELGMGDIDGGGWVRWVGLWIWMGSRGYGWGGGYGWGLGWQM